MCLCVDLIMTLRNPFYPNKRRLKWFVLYAVLIAGALTFLTSLPSDDFDNFCKNYNLLTNQNSRSDTAHLILAMSLSLYIIVALYSCIFAMRKLTRPGMSKEIKAYFIRRHFLYVFSFIVIWTIFLASSYFHIFHSPD